MKASSFRPSGRRRCDLVRRVLRLVAGHLDLEHLGFLQQEHIWTDQKASVRDKFEGKEGTGTSTFLQFIILYGILWSATAKCSNINVLGALFLPIGSPSLVGWASSPPHTVPPSGPLLPLPYCKYLFCSLVCQPLWSWEHFEEREFVPLAQITTLGTYRKWANSCSTSESNKTSMSWLQKAETENDGCFSIIS